MAFSTIAIIAILFAIFASIVWLFDCLCQTKKRDDTNDDDNDEEKEEKDEEKQ